MYFSHTCISDNHNLEVRRYAISEIVAVRPGLKSWIPCSYDTIAKYFNPIPNIYIVFIISHFPVLHTMYTKINICTFINMIQNNLHQENFKVVDIVHEHKKPDKTIAFKHYQTFTTVHSHNYCI